MVLQTMNLSLERLTHNAIPVTMNEQRITKPSNVRSDVPKLSLLVLARVLMPSVNGSLETISAVAVSATAAGVKPKEKTKSV